MHMTKDNTKPPSDIGGFPYSEPSPPPVDQAGALTRYLAELAAAGGERNGVAPKRNPVQRFSDVFNQANRKGENSL